VPQCPAAGDASVNRLSKFFHYQNQQEIDIFTLLYFVPLRGSSLQCTICRFQIAAAVRYGRPIVVVLLNI